MQEANHKASFGRSVLTLVLLILITTNEIKAAERAVRIYASNCSTEHQDALNQLVIAFYKSDGSTIKSTFSSTVFLSLRAEFKVICDEMDHLISDKVASSNGSTANNADLKPVKQKAQRKKSKSISGLELANDLEVSRPINLLPKNISKTYFDVTGFDVLDPRFGNAMTIDQWREFKRQESGQTDDFEMME